MQLTNEIICTQAGEGGTGVDGEGGTGVDGEGGTGVDGPGGVAEEVVSLCPVFHPSIRGWDTNLFRKEGGRGSVA